jgi:hypothetical protein
MRTTSPGTPTPDRWSGPAPCDGLKRTAPRSRVEFAIERDFAIASPDLGFGELMRRAGATLISWWLFDVRQMRATVYR